MACCNAVRADQLLCFRQLEHQLPCSDCARIRRLTRPWPIQACQPVYLQLLAHNTFKAYACRVQQALISSSISCACMCRSLDAALVSPGFPTPFPNVRHMPDLAEGMSFNLANNIWGTNYIMWQPYSGVGASMRFRFEISSKQQSGSELGQLRTQASGLPSTIETS